MSGITREQIRACFPRLPEHMFRPVTYGAEVHWTVEVQHPLDSCEVANVHVNLPEICGRASAVMVLGEFAPDTNVQQRQEQLKEVQAKLELRIEEDFLGEGFACVECFGSGYGVEMPAETLQQLLLCDYDTDYNTWSADFWKAAGDV